MTPAETDTLARSVEQWNVDDAARIADRRIARARLGLPAEDAIEEGRYIRES